MVLELKKKKVKKLSRLDSALTPKLTDKIAGGTASNPWYTAASLCRPN
ncbi:hypothetical protein N474_01115 [Pseudoalteromonas luteoviolacea CPMOR-2]|uniref:Uncharacterized protein n=1 Tax=Pseudoalteromonas luteoviolacea DSM 6061 TaxID=1365250 RepID=A0A166XMS3_9GAMM|nr:hypothetical protein N475_11520 [Pseudoalteromonas luteoviolacea DSM 6061]KZN55564.1 hypothetical protein N474_01115 [Pseudoalteromonas luteoviolacea CPMOR-2]MBE0389667.1 hypothetical protein [Pseudoalteromonas luteoviolacea DSM 6061]